MICDTLFIVKCIDEAQTILDLCESHKYRKGKFGPSIDSLQRIIYDLGNRWLHTGSFVEAVYEASDHICNIRKLIKKINSGGMRARI